MKFVSTQEHMARSIDLVQSALSGYNIIPVLSNIRFQAADGVVQVEATDNHAGIRTWLPGDVIEEGSTTIPGKLFHNYIHRLPAEEITVEATPNHRIKIEYQRGGCELIGLADDEFPVIPQIEESLLQVNGVALCSMIGDTQRFVSDDVKRPNLHGVYFDLESSPPTFVGSDGMRIAISSSGSLLKETSSETRALIVSDRTCQKIMSCFPASLIVNIGVVENSIIFSDGETTVVGTLIEASFPNYRKVVPKPEDMKSVKFETPELKRILKRVGTLADGETYKVTINIEKNKARISAQSQGEGEAIEFIDCHNDTGQEVFDIAFDLRWFQQALRPIQDPEFALHIKDAKSMVMIKSESNDGYKHLMSPMTISKG